MEFAFLQTFTYSRSLQVARKTPERKPKPWRFEGLICAGLALFLTGVLWLAGVLPAAERAIYDSAVAHTAMGAASDAVLVDIDARSQSGHGPGGWAYASHAALIDRLAEAGAKTVVYAVPLAVPTAPDAGAEALVRSIAQAGNVVWSAVLAHKGTPAVLPSSFHASVLPALAGRGPAQVPVQVGPFAAAAAGVGHLQWKADSDGVLRSLPLSLSHDNAGVPSLALIAAQRALYLGPNDIGWNPSGQSLRLGSLAIAVDASTAMRPTFRTSLARWAAIDVLENKVPAAALRDKTVIVGVTAGPEARAWTVPGGASVHASDVTAHAFTGLRAARPVATGGWAQTIAWAFVIVMALGVVGLPHLRKRAAWGVGLGVAVALAGAQWLLLQQTLHAVPLVGAAVVVLVGQLLCAGWALFPQRVPSVPAQELVEAERMMALALHGRGELLQAFERFRMLPTTDALKDNLYHLGMDFERKKDYALSKKVFKHLLRRDAEYKDTRARYRNAKTHLLAQAGMAPDSGTHSVSGLGASSLPASVQDALPRQRVSGPFAHYDLQHELGKGAMGVVYQGRDLRSGRTVAIKTLALQQEFDGAALIDARDRFFKEAEAAGRLQHPHIVAIYGSGEEQGLAYIAMEFVAGTDLSAFTQPAYLLAVEQVLSIGRCVALALDYAHAHQVVHRDVKPANIMWDAATDTVKVMDFGVARITDASKTRTGIVLGTPSFMSPEQLCGAKVDGRADLYALGVTLFQLLTGALPLRADSMPELMRKIVHVAPPDLRTLRPDVPDAVALLVAKVLQKQPGDRYQTGAQMAQALTDAMAAMAQQTAAKVGVAVVYDSGRTPAEQNMLELETTVLEHSQQRSSATKSVVAPVE